MNKAEKHMNVEDTMSARIDREGEPRAKTEKKKREGLLRAD